jgi:hypothetical protein
MATQATVTICDDVRLEFGGKLFIIGAFTADILVPAPEMTSARLVFLFHIDTEYQPVPRRIVSEVTLPGEAPLRQEDVLQPLPQAPERSRIWFRHSVLANNATLRPGKIRARVMIDDEEVEVAAAWITLQQPSPVSPA